MLKYQYVLRKLDFNFDLNSGENILFDNTVIKLNPPFHETDVEKKRGGKDASLIPLSILVCQINDKVDIRPYPLQLQPSIVLSSSTLVV